MHDMLRHAKVRALGAVIAGGALACVAACGFPFRRRGYSRFHSPFAFSEYDPGDILGVVLGLGILAYGLVRLLPVRRLLREVETTQDARFFTRAGMPRSIYELLLGVAATDGHVGPDEREAIARLLMRELQEGVLPQDLKNWATMVPVPRDPEALARSMAAVMSQLERDQVLQWCRAVALADGYIDGEENEVLSRVGAALRRS